MNYVFGSGSEVKLREKGSEIPERRIAGTVTILLGARSFIPKGHHVPQRVAFRPLKKAPNPSILLAVMGLSTLETQAGGPHYTPQAVRTHILRPFGPKEGF